MRVVTPSGTFDLGTTEATPTIGITDFSRRVTDEFGVTTVVERGFARRMSVRLLVPTASVDSLQAKLADLRATAALWVVDPALVWLNVDGFYKDFEIDHAVPPVSFCTLTVEGLADPGPVADNGADPSTSGASSTLRMVDPVTITDTVLVSSSVPEDDAPAWSPGSTYPVGATVVRGHRIYENLVASNAGADPATDAAKWLDTGPTNRWAAFDQALGTSTLASAPIEVVVNTGTPVSALAVLDTNAATVRARAPGYDRTVVPTASGKAIFLDIAAAAGAAVTVTITPASANPGPQHWDDGAQWMDAGVWRDSLAAGDGTVTVGTFLVGTLKGLGVTESSPTAGITDYSRKETDDFGETTIVQRAFAKRMSAKALIRTDAIDIVANRIAGVRARPCLWIGRTDQDSLTVYGFFKDFSIEVGKNVSKLSLSIEGLSKATPLKASATPGGGGSDFIAQGSVDGVTWHDGLQVGDIYLRTSTDNGATWGPAIKFVGEEGERGEDGSYQQQIFKRSPTRPATPTGGGIPAGWADGVPDGTDLIWMSVQYQRNGLALGAWSLPAQIKGDKGEPGEKAPLVRTQWSVDGNSLWHDTYADGDLYQRQSNDGGLTYGQAVRVVGESDGGSAGADGVSPSIVFRRSATIPATPTQDTGNPPPGWSDGPPAGIEILWQSTSRFRGALQLQPWSAPVRISGADARSISIVQSAYQLRTNGDGAYIGGQGIRFDVYRSNLPGVTRFERINADGSISFNATAAEYVSADPANFASDGPDNLILSSAGAIAQMNAFGGAVGKFSFRAYVPGFPETAIAVVTRVADGASGLNNATVYAYQRSASGAPAQPTSVSTYNFATTVLTGLNNGWSPTLPGGVDPLYIIAATASSAAATDTIAGAEWSGAVQSGANGTSGVNTKSLFIYQRANAAPALPSQNATYTFSTATLANLSNGWSATIPGGTLPIWISTATALSPTDVDNINPGEWASPQLLAQNGEKGDRGQKGEPGEKGADSTVPGPAGRNAIVFQQDATPSNPVEGDTWVTQTAPYFWRKYTSGQWVKILGSVSALDIIDFAYIADLSVGTIKIANGAITNNVAVQGSSISASNGGSSSTAQINLNATGLGYVRVDLQFDVRVNAQGTSGNGRIFIQKTQNGVVSTVGRSLALIQSSVVLPYAYWFLDSPSAGLVAYEIVVTSDSGNRIFFVSSPALSVSEFKK